MYELGQSVVLIVKDFTYGEGAIAVLIVKGNTHSEGLHKKVKGRARSQVSIKTVLPDG